MGVCAMKAKSKTDQNIGCNVEGGGGVGGGKTAAWRTFRRRWTLHHAVKNKRVTVQGSVKKPQMDDMSHRGGRVQVWDWRRWARGRGGREGGGDGNRRGGKKEGLCGDKRGRGEGSGGGGKSPGGHHCRAAEWREGGGGAGLLGSRVAMGTCRTGVVGPQGVLAEGDRVGHSVAIASIAPLYPPPPHCARMALSECRDTVVFLTTKFSVQNVT